MLRAVPESPTRQPELKGGAMQFTLADVLLAAILVCQIIFLFHFVF